MLQHCYHNSNSIFYTWDTLYGETTANYFRYRNSQKDKTMQYDILDIHRGVAEDSSLLGCYTVWLGGYFLASGRIIVSAFIFRVWWN
jgi:hypothetical protein